MAAWESREELGRRIRAVRGYLGENQTAFARRLATTDKTFGAMEDGRKTQRTDTEADRQRLARDIYDAVSEIPDEVRGLLDVAELATTEGERLTAQVEALTTVVRQLLQQEDRSELLAQLGRVDAFGQRLDSTSRQPEGQAPGAQNG